MCMPLMLSRSRTLSRRTGAAAAAGTPSAAFSCVVAGLVSSPPSSASSSATGSKGSEGPAHVNSWCTFYQIISAVPHAKPAVRTSGPHVPKELLLERRVHSCNWNSLDRDVCSCTCHWRACSSSTIC